MEELSALKGAAGPEKEARVKLEDLGGESSEDEEEEVDKLMRWATDAARLDVRHGGRRGRREGKVRQGGERSRRGWEEQRERRGWRGGGGGEIGDGDGQEEKEMATSKSKNKWFFF
jgi:hypothetical protein